MIIQDMGDINTGPWRQKPPLEDVRPSSSLTSGRNCPLTSWLPTGAKYRRDTPQYEYSALVRHILRLRIISRCETSRDRTGGARLPSGHRLYQHSRIKSERLASKPTS